VVPLLASRPLDRTTLAAGKIMALMTGITALLALSGAFNAIALVIVAGPRLDGETWLRLAAFCAVSALYVLVFALLGAVCAALCRSESTSLLVPVTIWLTLTFTVPQLTANINPMAALNPLSAKATPPSGPFFAATAAILGPVSVAEAYRMLAGVLLGIEPARMGPHAASGAIATLLLAFAAMAAAVVLAVRRLDACRGDYAD
jgi:ABC-type transport system involved in multi-copper enzyme maturation permease subunit